MRRASQKRHHALGSAALVDSFGDGLYLVGAALFFTRGLGLPVTETGLGLTVAGVLGITLSPELGRAADRLGPRRVFVWFMVCQAVAVSLFPLITGLFTLTAAATVAIVCRQGSQAARGGVIAMLAGDEAPQLRSYLHAVTNLGMSLGAAAAGVVIAIDSRPAYVTLMVTDAATFLVAALITTRLTLPVVPGAAQGTDRRRPRLALRDKTYVVLVGLSVLLSLQFVVSGYLLPLWVALHTVAPRWLVSPLLLVNTGIIVCFQVAFGRRIRSLADAAAAFRFSGLALAVSFCAFGWAGQVSVTASAVAVLVVAMVVHSAAELLTVGASSVVSFRLADPEAVSEYQGLWTLGFGTSVAIGPGLLTFTCLEHGVLGWASMGVVMAVTGAGMGAVVSRSAGLMPSPGPKRKDIARPGGPA